MTDQPDLANRLRLAHQARRAKAAQLDDVRRALCDTGIIQDDDPYSHADLADVIRQAWPTVAMQAASPDPEPDAASTVLEGEDHAYRDAVNASLLPETIAALNSRLASGGLLPTRTLKPITRTTPDNPPTSSVLCSGHVFQRPHSAHGWEPQPSMTPMHCPGIQAAGGDGLPPRSERCPDRATTTLLRDTLNARLGDATAAPAARDVSGEHDHQACGDCDVLDPCPCCGLRYNAGTGHYVPAAPATPDDGLRTAIVAALTAAAYQCDGDCGLPEHECFNAHPITWSGMVAGHTHIIGGAADIADAVLAVRDRQMEQLTADLAAERASLTRWLKRAAAAHDRARAAEAEVQRLGDWCRAAITVKDRQIEELAAEIATADRIHAEVQVDRDQLAANLARVQAVSDEWGEPYHCGWLSASVLVRQLRDALDGKASQ